VVDLKLGERVNARSCMLTAAIAALSAIGLPARAAAQLPFDLTQDDLSAVDTTAIRWTNFSTYVGGVEGDLRYTGDEATPGECKAVALLGAVRLRNFYRREQQDDPVTMRLGYRCGALYEGSLRYDGVVVRLELRDRSTGELLYQGRRRGPPL
jgi:hypothetical protein